MALSSDSPAFSGSMVLCTLASSLSWFLVLLYVMTPRGALELEISRWGIMHAGLVLPAAQNVLLLGFRPGGWRAWGAAGFLAAAALAVCFYLRSGFAHAGHDCDHDTIGLSAVQLANTAFGAVVAGLSLRTPAILRT